MSLALYFEERVLKTLPAGTTVYFEKRNWRVPHESQSYWRAGVRYICLSRRDSEEDVDSIAVREDVMVTVVP